MALIANTLNVRANGVTRKLVASGDVTHADTGAASDDVVLFELPAGSVITGTHAHITTAYDGTTPTLAIEVLNLDGSDLTSAVVLDADVDADALGRTSTYDVMPVATVAATVVTVKNTVADSTVGAATIDVEYYIQGRSDENNG